MSQDPLAAQIRTDNRANLDTVRDVSTEEEDKEYFTLTATCKREVEAGIFFTAEEKRHLQVINLGLTDALICHGQKRVFIRVGRSFSILDRFDPEGKEFDPYDFINCYKLRVYSPDVLSTVIPCSFTIRLCRAEGTEEIIGKYKLLKGATYDQVFKIIAKHKGATDKVNMEYDEPCLNVDFSTDV